MKLDSEKIVLGFLAVVVISSGCAQTQSEEAPKTNPVQITEFSASPNPAPAGMPVRFTVEMKNTGDATAKEVYVRLFGPSFATKEGSDARDLTWRGKNGGAMASKENRTFRMGTLRAPGESNPAIPQTKIIRVLSPEYGPGRVVTSNFNLKVFYKYRTTASTDLTLMTNERFRNTGGQTSQLTLQNSAGPIQMDIRGTSPKVFYTDEGRGDEICVIVRNDGKGTAFLANDFEGVPGARTSGGRAYMVNRSNSNRVKLTIRDVGNVNFVPKGSKVSGNSALVTLIDGRGIQCFKWGLDGSMRQSERTVNFQIEADYGYMKETTTSVTVEGRRQPDIGAGN